MSRPIISIEGVSKKYRLGQIGASSFREELERLATRFKGKSARSSSDFWALKDISVDINKGDTIGVIGRNGAGKSTLLKVLSRITEPTTGQITMRGRVASLLEVGTGFHPELSGYDNIFLNGAILGMKKAEIQSKLDEIIAFSEIEKFINTPVKRYSSGMYVKLAFAVAAHLEPEILIVDEVLAVGDQAFQQKCLGKMNDISESEGRTILFVSHYMAAVRRLCKKCLYLEQGRTEGVIGVEEGIERYSNYNLSKDSFVELDQVKRAETTLGDKVRFKSIELKHGHQLQYADKMELEFTLDSTDDFDEMALGVAFDSLDRGRALTLDSDSSGNTFSLKKGTNKITISLDFFPLNPGIYDCRTSIFSGNFYYDTVRIATWEIANSSKDTVSDRGATGCRLAPHFELSHG